MLELLVPDETKEKGYVITGDVDFENVSKKSKFYYPVPGEWAP
jgi:methylenetetrahydrofolate dehydrogenase (NADP+)/methenyltetrahydrofolate cyclohydrolase